MSKVLIVEDHQTFIEFISDCLIKQNRKDDQRYEVFQAKSKEEATNLLHTHNPDIVLLDLGLPKTEGDAVEYNNGLEFLEASKETYRDMPVIMITGELDDIGSAVKRAMEQNADDFVLKATISGEKGCFKLIRTVDMWLNYAETKKNYSKLEDATLENLLIGRSEVIKKLREKIKFAANFEVQAEFGKKKWPCNILIRGKLGSGKGLVAKAIHLMDPKRRDKNFESINCASLTFEMAEVEIFGVKKGFASGVSDQTGKIEQAGSGTLFLDELGDSLPTVLPKLNKIIDERVFEKKGCSEPRDVKCRIIAATNRELEEMERNGTFREDLRSRFHQTIMVPSLDERKEDIEILAWHFLNEICDDKKSDIVLTESAFSYLEERTWPENVRGLKKMLTIAGNLAFDKGKKPYRRR